MSQVILFDMFFKVEKTYVERYSLKERFNKMEIEIDAKNGSQLKRTRKPPLLLSQKESLAEQVKTFLKNFPCPKSLLFFHVLTTFFSKF